MVAPIIPLVAKAGGEKAAAALTHDLAVVRWTIPGRTVGKGRAKRKKPDKDVELHINPVSIGVGGAALGITALTVGIGAYALGMGAKRTTGKDLTRRVVNYYKREEGVLTYTRTVVYSDRGRPLKTLPDVFSRWDQVLTDRERTHDYRLTEIVGHTDEDDTSRKEVYCVLMHSDTQPSWGIYDRPRNPLFNFLSEGLL